MKEVRLSEVWLFGIDRLRLDGWDEEKIIDYCMHTHPNGQYIDDPIMSLNEAEMMARNKRFPDSVWDRLK